MEKWIAKMALNLVAEAVALVIADAIYKDVHGESAILKTCSKIIKRVPVEKPTNELLKNIDD